jgi:hypothetical protein
MHTLSEHAFNKKDACHDTFQYYSLKHCAIVHCIHKIIKVQDVWYHGAHIYIYIFYMTFLLGWARMRDIG